MTNKLNIMIVTGEASGDLHAAKLVHALRESSPETDLNFFGATGERLREAGVESIVDADHFSIVGLPEIARAMPMFLRAFRDLKNAAAERMAVAAILVDLPDFNLKLAKSLKKKGLTVIYYISPQLWAWRSYRVETIRKYVDLLITILPFEKAWYERQGIHHVEYVGSPLAMEVHPDISKDEFCKKHGLDPSKPIVALLPGSRHKEIVRILPVMLETASLMAKRRTEIQFVVAMGSEPLAVAGGLMKPMDTQVSIGHLQPPATAGGSDKSLIVVYGETYDALNASDAAAVTSGTATLETGIIGTPMAIVYKTSALNYKLLRPLISVEHFGLINLIAEKRIAKEMIQDDFTPQALAAELFRLLEPAENARVREQLKEATDKLGHGGASKRAAEAIVKILSR